ncbi:DNA alkylation repair protein [Aminicella lysinilytica]|uniref:3-methyladenine DNA glycosylase AlkD n=1 Tax=Aminicella lysinilytica TaxID=433323 RepID=A0A4R6QCJ0_9FIRM|nr:DNA alkylation repair protein [Aminicella lysinilytica]TDP59079.1 3-methyladenine DNA glycosylase AlkD [Aminicella lysinilytica]
MNAEIEIRNKLISLAEPEYRDFSSALVPGCGDMLGVRIPIIRGVAKDIAVHRMGIDPIEYLENAEEKYFEETMLKGLIIGELKGDVEVVLAQVAKHIPKVTNWSLCDSFCAGLKITKKNKARVWSFLESYWQSEKPFEIRVAVVMYLDYYIDKEHIEDLFYRFDHINNDDHYVKMAVAWAVSTCFIKSPEETMKYLKSNDLDDETYNMALQKIRDSLRVDKETKEMISTMKR